MKKLSLFVFLLSMFAQDGLSKCALQRIKILPASGLVSKNQVFVLNVGLHLEAEVLSIIQNNQIYLKSFDSRIPLAFCQINPGVMQVQIVLYNIKPLNELVSYKIIIDENDKHHLRIKDHPFWMCKDYSKQKKEEKLKVRLTGSSSPPYFHCGSSQKIYFEISPAQNHISLIDVRVFNLKTKSYKIFITEVTDRQHFSIGFSCYGNFMFSRKGNYSISFKPIGAADWSADLPFGTPW